MNVAFFAASSVSGLASIVTAIKFSKFLQGLSSPCEISRGGGGGGLEPLSSSILYAYGRSNKVDEVVKTFYFSKN